MNTPVTLRPAARLRWRRVLLLGLLGFALLLAGLGWLGGAPAAPGVRLAGRTGEATLALHGSRAPNAADVPAVTATAAAPLASAAPPFEDQLLGLLYGAPGPQALWQLFQAGRDSHQPEQRYLAYQALRVCAASVPPFSTLPAPLAARPVWLTDESTLLADRARTDLLARCAPFASISRPEWQRHERELQGALETGPDRAGTATEPDAQALALTRERLRDFFARYSGAALAWAGSDLVDYLGGLQRLQDTAAAAGSGTKPALARLTQGATELALCELGAACGADSSAALLICYSTGNCTGSLQERLLSAYATPAERDAATLQASELAAALRSGDLSRYGL